MKTNISNGKPFTSKVRYSLDLLAPDAENKDLFYRRLREGNKDNWLDELAHSEREIASIEDKLATLYERRGQIVEVYACPRF